MRQQESCGNFPWASQLWDHEYFLIVKRLWTHRCVVNDDITAGHIAMKYMFFQVLDECSLQKQRDKALTVNCNILQLWQYIVKNIHQIHFQFLFWLRLLHTAYAGTSFNKKDNLCWVWILPQSPTHHSLIGYYRWWCVCTMRVCATVVFYFRAHAYLPVRTNRCSVCVRACNLWQDSAAIPVLWCVPSCYWQHVNRAVTKQRGQQCWG